LRPKHTSKVGRYMDLVVKKKLLKHLRAHETSKSVPSTFSLTLPTNSSTSISTIEADLVQKAVKSAFLKV
jgi:hypothetical protein